MTLDAMRPHILLVGGDLNAKARVLAAADRIGLALRTCSPDELEEAARAAQPALLVADLDEAPEALDAIVALRDAGALAPDNAIVYFSHVAEALGRAAEERSVKAMPRGRFWRELPALVEAARDRL